MPEKNHQIEVRTTPPKRDDPIDPMRGEEWHPVRRAHGGIHKFETPFEAEHAMKILERSMPHALFRVALAELGRHRRSI